MMIKMQSTKEVIMSAAIYHIFTNCNELTQSARGSFADDFWTWVIQVVRPLEGVYNEQHSAVWMSGRLKTRCFSLVQMMLVKAASTTASVEHPGVQPTGCMDIKPEPSRCVPC